MVRRSNARCGCRRGVPREISVMEQAEQAGAIHGVFAVGGVELEKHVLEVPLHSLLADVQRELKRAAGVQVDDAAAVTLLRRAIKARKEAAGSLLNYGFRFYETVEVFAAMHELEQPRVWKGQQDLVPVGLIDRTVLTLPRGKSKELVTSVELDPQLVAPLAVGDRVGTLKLSLGEKTVYEAPVVALAAVEQAGFFVRLWDSIVMWFSSLFAA